MPIHYSASERGFFDDVIHSTLPTDAIEITSAIHADLLARQCDGAQIVPDRDGRPIAINPPPPSTDALLATLRYERNRRLAESDYTQISDLDLSDTRRAEWRLYRKALRDLPETVADPSNVEWPQPPAN